MIWNKRREYNVRVVDIADNAIYSGDDVKVTIGEADTKGISRTGGSARPKAGHNHIQWLQRQLQWCSLLRQLQRGYSSLSGRRVRGNTNTAAASTKTKAETKPAATTNPALKTVTGGAAPKIDSAKSKGSESNLMKYYQENPNDLMNNWNSSCYPYADAFQD